jgi:hypothetical protein
LPNWCQINKRVRANLRELKVDEVPMSVFPRGTHSNQETDWLLEKRMRA